MEQVIIRQGKQEFLLELPKGTSLLTALRRAGISVNAPCGGNHTCGKCVVRANGALSEVTEREQALLGKLEGRLACLSTIQGECCIEVEEDGAGTILTGSESGRKGAGQPLFRTGYGVAVDIGTTTLATYLYGPKGDEPLATTGVYNQQRQYGADVMTRIAFDCEDKENTLRNVICSQLSDVVGKLCAEAGCEADDISVVVLTGNTIMLHFIAGLNTRSLALAPYKPVSLFGDWIKLPVPGLEGARFYLAPCISGYVGADITCDILASGILDRNGNHLLLDVGTNGEMVLKFGDRLVCCSTAAGPAFEGADISCGSEAVPGAICSVSAVDGALRYKTVAGSDAISICGSGLIDAVAACLELDMIADSGRINTPLGKITFPGCDVTLSQKDIRQLQLAKAAIRTGIEVMLYTCGMDHKKIDGLLLCDGFGSYLDPRSAETIGMLPPGCGDKAEVLGNTAGAGAAEILLREDAAAEADRIAKHAQYIELSTSPIFMEKFMEYINFK